MPDAPDRLLHILSTDTTATGDGEQVHRRVAAGRALAALAHESPGSVAEFLPEVGAAIRRESGNTIRECDVEPTDAAWILRATLIRTVGRVIVESPGVAEESDAFSAFLGAITCEFDDRTLRVATKALFVSAHSRAAALAAATDLLAELLGYPDTGVPTWAAGTVGRLAETRPDEVAAIAPALRRLLAHEDTAVQHNAVEALAVLARHRSECVAPAGGALRELLVHDETAIQYNAAGVLGYLAATHPAAVRPAIEDLHSLLDHDNDAVDRMARSALLRLELTEPDIGDMRYSKDS